MHKETLVAGADYKFKKFKKAAKWTARLAGVFLVAAASTERYHNRLLVDNSPSESPKTERFNPNLTVPASFAEIVFPLVKSPEIDNRTLQGGNIQLPELEEKVWSIAAPTQELDGIKKLMEKHPELFSETDFEDIEMYFPIYQAAGAKYQIPWYLLWIVHKVESTASRNETAFGPGRTNVRAMQRAKAFYSKEDVRAAATGLEYLAHFPQRYDDDWEEIVWAASKLRADWNREGSLLAALYHYSSAGSAEYRYQLFGQFSEIFN